MATPNLHPETMAELFPDLFRTAQPRGPVNTFAEQHAAALAVVVRQPMPPAACQLMAELDAIACARKVA